MKFYEISTSFTQSLSLSKHWRMWNTRDDCSPLTRPEQIFQASLPLPTRNELYSCLWQWISQLIHRQMQLCLLCFHSSVERKTSRILYIYIYIYGTARSSTVVGFLFILFVDLPLFAGPLRPLNSRQGDHYNNYHNYYYYNYYYLHYERRIRRRHAKERSCSR